MDKQETLLHARHGDGQRRKSRMEKRSRFVYSGDSLDAGDNYTAPLLLPVSGQQWLYDTVPNYAYWAGVAGLGMYTASRVAEQCRSGFSSIPADQYRAAYASGLRTFQVYRWVIIPYGFRLILPTITTEFLTCFKNSALTMTIGVMETTHTAYYIDSFTWHGLETTTAASLVYLTIAWTVIAVMGQVEKRVYIPGHHRPQSE